MVVLLGICSRAGTRYLSAKDLMRRVMCKADPANKDDGVLSRSYLQGLPEPQRPSSSLAGLITNDRGSVSDRQTDRQGLVMHRGTRCVRYKETKTCLV